MKLKWDEFYPATFMLRDVDFYPIYLEHICLFFYSFLLTLPYRYLSFYFFHFLFLFFFLPSFLLYFLLDSQKLQCTFFKAPFFFWTILQPGPETASNVWSYRLTWLFRRGMSTSCAEAPWWMLTRLGKDSTTWLSLLSALSAAKLCLRTSSLLSS